MSDSSKELSQRVCVPCKGGVPPLKGEDLASLHEELGAPWKVVDEHHLERMYKFKDFERALAFTNVVGGIAEEAAHHPDILTAWGKVVVTIWTHKIDGLTEGDFVFAARVEEAFRDAL